MTRIYAMCALLAFAAPIAHSADNYPGVRSGPPPQMGSGAVRAPLDRVSAPEAMVREGVNSLTTYVRSRKDLSSPKVVGFLENEIAPYFDFAYMTRKAAGPMYRRLGTRERAQLEERLKRMFLSTLARNLSNYRGQDVRIFTDRGSLGRSQTKVNAWLMEPQGYPTKLEFRFYRAPDGAWSVYDVSANGTSAVMYYRGYIQRMMRQYGPRWLGT